LSDFQKVFENGMAPAGTASVNYKYKQKVADALKNNGVVGGIWTGLRGSRPAKNGGVLPENFSNRTVSLKILYIIPQ
jgi:hypothetical protein